MLPFLEELLEKKLSELLGADVRFDRFKASPLSGKIEVLNLSAKAPEAGGDVNEGGVEVIAGLCL
jgi:hypothetical protein